MLPLLNPKGPVNTAPADLVLGAGILMVAVWAGTTRARVHVPYVVPVGGLAVAGLVAALAGEAPIPGGSAVLQEVFLLGWCAAVTSVCRTPRALQSVVRAWCLSATAWAVLLVVVTVSGRPALAGVIDGRRAGLWFDHPNMAGNYFVIAFFVVLAARYPRQPMARALAVAVLLVAVLLTGSNTALLGVPVGGLVIVFLRVRSRGGPVTALAVVLCLILAGGAAWAVVAEPTVARIQQSESSIVRYSVARTSRSASARESLFTSQYELFQDGNLLGIGPAATRLALGETGAATAKESHNDYLATLVERGPLGVVALLVLMGAVGVRALSAQRLSPVYASVIPNAAALAAAAVVFAVTALTHEVLHYRHLWTLLAVLAALHLFGQDRPALPTGARASGERVPHRADGW